MSPGPASESFAGSVVTPAPRRYAAWVRPQSTSVATLAVVTALASASGGAGAMEIRQERRLLARSAKGASALYEVRGFGPEGGGSLTYRIEGKGRRKALEFLVSSDFSPGGSSHPQLVPVGTCEERLDALSAELVKHGFRGVAVSPERCRSPERDGLVTVATLPAPTPPAHATIAAPRG